MTKDQVLQNLKEIDSAIQESLQTQQQHQQIQQQHMANHNALLGMQMLAKKFLGMFESAEQETETVIESIDQVVEAE